MDNSALPELQSIGVRGIRYPVTALDRAHGEQHTVAIVDLRVELPHQLPDHRENTLVEILGRHRHGITIDSIELLLREMREAFDAHAAHLDLRFPYFLRKRAPVSGSESVMEYDCRIVGRLDGDFHREIEVQVPVTLLYPHDGTGRGTRNQRCVVTVTLHFKRFVWFEELIELVEHSASCDLFALLKRADEKHVTRRAYDRPVTLVDLVRGIGRELAEDPGITWFRVVAENLDSVHNHNTYASVEWSRTSLSPS
ncbi:MAG: GTP cyclohydrolase I FolE2 [Deltaproteobacteria bacterium]|nr:GTP cyclohydrolase I FolE2 [Deltaproteobacteria bacterium]